MSSSTPPSTSDPPYIFPEPTLHRQRHITYWLRNLKTCLPTGYTQQDLNRQLVACFSLSALSLLSSLHSSTTPEERADWITWLYSTQLPTGGFRGSPATDPGPLRTESNAKWDPMNLPASFFAVASLITLSDDLERLNRRGLLECLNSLQLQDGSFGECWNGAEVQGGQDQRFVLCAVQLRWLLRGRHGRGCKEVPDFDVDAVVRFIRASQSYDAGVGEKEWAESHAGHTYCALGALTLLGRVDEGLRLGREEIVRWLVMMQVPMRRCDAMDEEEADELSEEAKSAAQEIECHSSGLPIYGGFAGRCNKLGDTCYSWWVGAALEMLSASSLMDTSANRRFLLGKTQHIIGGFAKLPDPGYLPDVLHAYLGLAALALNAKEEGLEEIDAALCMTRKAKERLMGLEWWREGRL